MILGVQKIIGKTIAGVVVKKSYHYPKSQVFLIFSDNTSFELYTDQPEIKGNTDLQPYGLNGVKAYLAESHEILHEFYDETVAGSNLAALDSNKKNE